MNRRYRVLRRSLATALLLAAAVTTLAAAPEPTPEQQPPLDTGQFTISVDGRRLGVERFTFRELGDSLCLSSQTLMVQDMGDGRRDTVNKQVFMAVGKDDYLLHAYQSNETFRGRQQIRGIVMGDTLFTLYREVDGHGSGDRLILPPGRMYVMDSRLFSLIELVTLSLHGQTFDRRPVTVLTLGDRDTVVEATLARAGRDTLRVAGAATPATRWQLIQGPVTLQLWTDAVGRLLRVAHPPTGLLVERQPARVKPASKPPAKRGG
ncbi:MAG: hypothetical protein ACHQ52_08875 [Candidatus Eisenbacteria bacterium]